MENKAFIPKVLIMTPGILPVPAVRGGAVEKLITDIIGENEIRQAAEITVVTVADDGISAGSYRHTRIVQAKKTSFISLLDRGIDKIQKIFHAGKSFRMFDLCLMKALKKNVGISEFDIVIVENMTGLAEAFVNEAKKEGCSARVFVHIHNKIDMYRSPESVKKLTAEGVTFLTVSRYLKDEILKHSPDARVSVLYNGIDTGLMDIKLKDKKDVLREKYSVPKDATVILYSGRIIEEKGVYELVHGFARHKESIPGSDLFLVMAGSGSRGNGDQTDYEKKVYREADRIKSSIRLLGQIPYESIPELYALADVLVLPTKVDEAFGLVVLEGMFMGLPVVTTATGGVPEVLEDEAGRFRISRERLCDDLAEVFAKTGDPVNRRLLEEMGAHNLELSRKKQDVDKAGYFNRFLSAIGVITEG